MTLDLQPGATFGEYILERRLGGGGFGDVWLAHDASGQNVALKVLHGQYQSSEAAKVRAEIELLAAAASSRSEHIVRVLGGGSEPAPYVVMEYIDGTDLGQEIARRGALPVDEVLNIAEGVADALATLQRAGIIHRDIKPANVMIDPQGVVKLTDFGIAKIVGTDTLTTTNQIAASVAYAAPEVFDGHSSHLSDHYSFGALLYHCLAGRPPFSGTSAQIMRQHFSTPPNLETLPSETPRALRRLVADCMAKEPGKRPPNANRLLEAIRTAVSEAVEAGNLATIKPLREPGRIGPWIILERSDDEDWAFLCYHQQSGEEAIVRLFFTDHLEDGALLRAKYPERSGRLLLRPGEGWLQTLPRDFVFWTAFSPAEGFNTLAQSETSFHATVAGGVTALSLTATSLTGSSSMQVGELHSRLPGTWHTTSIAKLGLLLSLLAVIGLGLILLNGKIDPPEESGEGDASVVEIASGLPANPVESPSPTSSVLPQAEVLGATAVPEVLSPAPIGPVLLQPREAILVPIVTSQPTITIAPQAQGLSTRLPIKDNFTNPSSSLLERASGSGFQASFIEGEYSVTTNAGASGVGPFFGEDVADVSISVDARLVGESSNRNLGIKCRANPSLGNSYLLTVRPSAGTVTLQRVTGGTGNTILGTTRVSTQPNGMVRLELSCKGNTIVGRVNGVQLGPAQDDSFRTGRLQFHLWSNPVGVIEARFDNLELDFP